MQTEILMPFITYAIVTTITPGPNNVTSTSAGVKLGYKKSLPYLFGITLGVFMIIAVSGLLTDFILKTYSSFSLFLKWIGASYMIWLALAPFIHLRSDKFKKINFRFSFLSGLTLQLINIKVILYGLTLYSSFALLIGVSTIAVIISAIFLTTLCFSCISLWTIIGATLSTYFKNKTFYFIFNAIMGALLIYSAISILLY